MDANLPVPSRNLAFVLAGGGARGALQAGALRVLLERGLRPDFLIGTSIGAVNAAFLAIHGFSDSGLDLLDAAWDQASRMDILPANYFMVAVRRMLGRSAADPAHRLREFFIANGLLPDLCFSDLTELPLYIVSADLNIGQPVIHGQSADDRVLDALLLSTALPPWVMPRREQGRYSMDGGVVSNLPVEPALRLGATHIIALDLIDTREMFGSGPGLVTFLDRLSMTVEKRQSDLELALARAQRIPLLYLGLLGEIPVPYWDFRHTVRLRTLGYETAQRLLDEPGALEEF